MRAKVLLYHLGETTATGAALRELLRARKLAFFTLREDMLDTAVGELAARRADCSFDDCTAQEDAFMLLCALGERQLDRLLGEMRRAGLSVPYKAVLTETNRTWTLRALMQAVRDEHARMRG